MEGTLVDLPGIEEEIQGSSFIASFFLLRSKSSLSTTVLFVDEAHSVGVIGPRQRGVTDYLGIDPRSVDILMGNVYKVVWRCWRIRCRQQDAN